MNFVDAVSVIAIMLFSVSIRMILTEFRKIGVLLQSRVSR